MTHLSALMIILMNFSVKKSGEIFYDTSKQKGFPIFHCNIRRLEKIKSLLHDISSTVKTMPDIIAISESKAWKHFSCMNT